MWVYQIRSKENVPMDFIIATLIIILYHGLIMKNCHCLTIIIVVNHYNHSNYNKNKFIFENR